MNHKHLQMLVYTALLLGIGMILPGITMGIPLMAFEMATYGLIIGLLFSRLRPQSLTTIYISRSLLPPVLSSAFPPLFSSLF